jgi:hypothetical protein
VKRALAFVAAIAVMMLVAGGAVVAVTNTARRRSGELQWPRGLGTLEEFSRAYPKADTTPAARRLLELARPLSIDLTPSTRSTEPVHADVGAYVRSELGSGALAIATPSPAVVEFLTAHETELDALRDHLLHDTRIGWTIDPRADEQVPLPNFIGHLQTGRLLIVRALLRARGGDARAWLDLEAAAALERSIAARPELISQLIALALARAVNAAAWKLPMPAPPWFVAAGRVDRERLLLRGLQYEAWRLWRYGTLTGDLRFGPAGVLFERAAAAKVSLELRDTAVELSQITSCGFDGAYFRARTSNLPRWNVFMRSTLPEFGKTFARVRRFAAEREAVANALRVRAGQPMQSQSRCSDGAWLVESGRLRFTRDIPRSSPSEMPLTLVISAP